MNQIPNRVTGDRDTALITSWTHRGFGSASMRGIPNSVWRAAMSHRQPHPGLSNSLH